MFSWCELMTGDVEAAREFYSAVFGWECQEVPMPGMNYTLVKVDDQEVGGMMKMPAEAGDAPPQWCVYVTVDDPDAVAKAAAEQGGTVVIPPCDIPEVGRFCVIQDPQGATIRAIRYVEQG
jgi:predicted enzyme related to lactoylglutathione lyase